MAAMPRAKVVVQEAGMWLFLARVRLAL